MNLVGIGAEVIVPLIETPFLTSGGGIDFDFEFDPNWIGGGNDPTAMIAPFTQFNIFGRADNDSVQFNQLNGSNVESSGSLGLGIDVGCRLRWAIGDQSNMVVSGAGRYAHHSTRLTTVPFVASKTQAGVSQFTTSDDVFGWLIAPGVELGTLNSILRVEAYVSSVESELFTGRNHDDTTFGVAVTRVYNVGDLVAWPR